MNLTTPEAVFVFALALVPGIVALELFQTGRPRLRETGTAQTLALFLVLSAVAWAIALLADGLVGFDVPRTIAEIVVAAEQRASEGLVSSQVTSYAELGGWVLLCAVVVGLGLRALDWIARKLAFEASQWARRKEGDGAGSDATRGGKDGGEDRTEGLCVGRAAVANRALERGPRCPHSPSGRSGRVRRGRRPGLLDYQADGRGILLDRELVVNGPKLDELRGCTGMFVAPEAIASVTFIGYSAANQPSERAVS